MILEALFLIATITVSIAFIMWRIDYRKQINAGEVEIKFFKEKENEFELLVITERQMKSKRKQAEFN